MITQKLGCSGYTYLTERNGKQGPYQIYLICTVYMYAPRYEFYE